MPAIHDLSLIASMSLRHCRSGSNPAGALRGHDAKNLTIVAARRAA
jgi:hypothetical protein